MFNPSFHRIKATASLFLIGMLVGITHATAQVFLTFSGGGGISPVTVSWSSPITYTLTFTSPNSGVNPYFVFQSIPNGQAAFPVEGGVAGVAPTYTGTGTGSSDGLQTINSFYGVPPANAQNAVFANDVVAVAFGDTAPTILTAGDVITLSAGSLVYSSPSNSPYFGVLPTSGYYNTIVVDAAYVDLGSGVSAIPEPSTYAALFGLGALGFAAYRKRRR